MLRLILLSGRELRRYRKQTGGAEMRSGFAVYPFPFGQLMIGWQQDAVTLLKRTDEPAREEGRTPLTGLVFRQVSEYLEGRRREFDFPYLLEGTEFQRKVWRALCEIPYGETRTYGEVAAAVGNPKAYRAVGMANHQNPILIAVPCHRVIGADGRLVGYGSGLDMKEALLRLEKRAAQEERRPGAAGIRGEQSSGKTRR